VRIVESSNLAHAGLSPVALLVDNVLIAAVEVGGAVLDVQALQLSYKVIVVPDLESVEQ